MEDQWTQEQRKRIEAQLERLLVSSCFKSAELLQRLLKYLVIETLSGRDDHINQTSIAIDVLGRDADFDPSADAVVRVEARRLRSRLIEYYYEDGAEDRIRFELPKGHYIPKISLKAPKATDNRQKSYVGSIGNSSPGKYSIAVLAFRNLSDDSANEYFSDGISEELLTLLAKVPQLQVAAHTSSFAYKGQNVGVEKIGKELHVAYVLEGSVRKAGNRVRITAQLIQTVDGFHVWSESWDRTLNNVFAIQDEIAAGVVANLKIKLLGEVPTAREVKPEAFALYLQARHVVRQGTASAWNQAIELYRQSLGIDPDYAAAWDGLAAIYIQQIGWGLRSSNEGCKLVSDAARKALAIDPDFAKAYTRLSWVAMVSGQSQQDAIQPCARALDIDGTDPDILGYAAALAINLGHLDQAIAVREYLVRRDPVNAMAHRILGNCYLWRGYLNEALTSFRTVLTLSPDYIGTQQLVGLTLLRKGQAEAALQAIKSEKTESYRLIGLVMTYHALGQKDASDQALAKLIDQYESEAAYNIAFALAFRDEPDRAFTWLTKAVANSDPGLSQIAVEPLFMNIQEDPRWPEFLENIGKAKDQLDAIEFAIKLP